MSEQWPKVPLGHILSRRKDEIFVDDSETYSRLTIRLNGEGIEVRDILHAGEIDGRSMVSKS